MSIKGTLRTYTLSKGTQAIRIWKGLELAKKPTGAASRLILLDAKGEIPADVLCEWLNDVEIVRKKWEQEKLKKNE